MFNPKTYTESFEREQGFTTADWLQVLPGAVGAHVLTLDADGLGASVAIGGGRLQMRWQVLPVRAIAMMRMPRLAVQFRFSPMPDAVRAEFMRYFDLYTQRGGG